MSDFVTTQNFVILMSHIQDTVQNKFKKDGGKKYPQKQFISEVLDKIGKQSFPINPILKGNVLLRDSYKESLMEGLSEVMRFHGMQEVDVDHLPPNLRAKYEPLLAKIYGDQAVALNRSAPPLKALAAQLKGIWRLFYVTPDTARTKRLISNVAFLHNGGANSAHATAFMLGPRHNRWSAKISRTSQNYLAFDWQELNGEEASSMLALFPDASSGKPKIAGILTVVQQHESVGAITRSITSTICFGTKCDADLDECGIGGMPSPDMISSEKKAQLLDALKRAEAGENLTEADEDLLRQNFRKIDFPLAALHDHFKPTVAYLKQLQESRSLLFNASDLSDVLDA